MGLRKLTISLMALAFAPLFSTLLPAGDFDSGSPSLKHLDAQNVPTARAAAVKTAQEQTLDLTLSVPFQMLNAAFNDLSTEDMKVIDPQKPVLSSTGDSILLSNLLVNSGGIEVRPVVNFKPYFEGVNQLAIKITKVDVNLSMGPDRAPAMFSKNIIMAQVMDQFTQTAQDEITKALAIHKLAVKAEDVLAFKYDPDAWVLHVIIKPTFISPLMSNMVDMLNLTAFSFNNDALTVKAHSSMPSTRAANQAAAKMGIKCGVSFNDVLINNILSTVPATQKFDLFPQGHAGGVTLLGNNRMTLAGKTTVSSLPFSPTAYFTATFSVRLLQPGLINVVITDIDVDQIGALPMPALINSILSNMIISSAVDSIVSDDTLSQVMTARKVSDSSMNIILKPSAFLPSFAAGTALTSLRIDPGSVSLSLEP